MTVVKLPQRSFAGGEITPEMFGRIDLTKNQTGVQKALNFIALPHGPMARRPGTMFFNEVRDSTQTVRLVPFMFSATQAMQLEVGAGYIRFHSPQGTLLEVTQNLVSIVGNVVTQNAHGYATGDWVFLSTPGGRFFKITVTGANTYTTADMAGAATNPSAAYTKGARVYQIANVFTAGQLFDLHYAQNADVMTFTHPSIPAQELRRLSNTLWTIGAASFIPTLVPPTAPTATATVAVATNLTPQHYVVTSVAADTVTESLTTADFTCNNNLSLAGNYNVIQFTSADAASRYFVYKQRGGVYGYIGQITSISTAAAASISSIARNAGVDADGNPLSTKLTTVVTTAAHGFATNDIKIVENTGIAAFNGTWKITVVNATTFTFNTNDLSSDNTVANTGTVRTPVNLLVDDNITPDITQTPPDSTIPLNDAPGNYPSAVTHHEQRRWFAGTNNRPQNVIATRSGTDANLTASVPARDDDALNFKIAASQQNAIRHLVPLFDLIALTVAGEFRVFADNAPAITPKSLAQKPQSYCGAANTQPVVTNSSGIFVQAQGSHIMELAYDPSGTGAYRTTDVSLFAPHLVNGFTIVQLAYVRAPDKIVWVLRSDGTLLGMTYVPEQQVFAWHQHVTDGVIESISVIPETGEDALYMVVRRTVNGRTVRYIERMMSRIYTTLTNAFYVDAGVTYSGAPITNLSGLDHLVGRSVQVLADGAVVSGLTITAGGALSAALATAASKVTVGLAYTSDLQTLPLSMDGTPAGGKGTMKNVDRVHLRLANSSPVLQAGPSFTELTPFPSRAVSDPYGSPPAVRSGEVEMVIGPSWDPDASICIREDQPVPLTISAITYEVAIGG
jgi:hypothetical protein